MDPNFALAYTGKADCYTTLAWYDYLSPKDVIPSVKAAAQRALEIDDNLAEAYTTMANIKEQYEWDFVAAERAYKKAIELNPSYATAHHWYALFLIMMGRHEEAIAEAELAKQLDPLSLIIATVYGGVYMNARQYEQAIRIYKDVLEMYPNYLPAHIWLGVTFEVKEMYEEAIKSYKKALSLSEGRSYLAKGFLGSAYALSGNIKKAQEILDELIDLSRNRYISPLSIAGLYNSLGQKNLSFKWLEKGYEIRDHWMISLKVAPMWDGFREDPRFKDLLKRIGLEK
jgi:tetratricopeptide (TPR) repeat protein